MSFHDWTHSKTPRPVGFGGTNDHSLRSRIGFDPLRQRVRPVRQPGSQELQDTFDAGVQRLLIAMRSLRDSETGWMFLNVYPLKIDRSRSTTAHRCLSLLTSEAGPLRVERGGVKVQTHSPVYLPASPD